MIYAAARARRDAELEETRRLQQQMRLRVSRAGAVVDANLTLRLDAGEGTLHFLLGGVPHGPGFDNVRGPVKLCVQMCNWGHGARLLSERLFCRRRGCLRRGDDRALMWPETGRGVINSTGRRTHEKTNVV